ncbi:MAG: asparagine synthetase A [Candidatus Micrarchaeota archaeon]
MSVGMEKMLGKISSPRMADALRVQSAVLKSVSEFMAESGVVQLLPVIVSPVTDPLAHTVVDASIEYYGQKLQLTKSMILHKQVALLTPGVEAIYVVSPNVRLETEELKDSDRHLIEFTQVDIEFKHGGKEKFLGWMERLMERIVKDVKRECAGELERFGSEVQVPTIPFKRFETKDAVPKYGKTVREAEVFLSKTEPQMFWLLDHLREFYDREEPAGYFHNYDLIYPGGFGEGASGAEREHEYGKIVKKIRERNQKPEEFGVFSELAEKGFLKRTVGAGFGVERLVRYLCGVKDISDVSPFAKKPAEKSLL